MNVARGKGERKQARAVKWLSVRFSLSAVKKSRAGKGMATSLI